MQGVAQVWRRVMEKGEVWNEETEETRGETMSLNEIKCPTCSHPQRTKGMRLKVKSVFSSIKKMLEVICRALRSPCVLVFMIRTYRASSSCKWPDQGKSIGRIKKNTLFFRSLFYGRVAQLDQFFAGDIAFFEVYPHLD